MGKVAKLFLLGGLLSASLVYFIFPNWIKDPEPPPINDFDWWGRGAPPTGAEKAAIVSKPFKIEVKESELQDLKRRLKSTRYSEPLEKCNFNYGFPSDQLKKVVDYWLTKYDWKVHERHLNQYKHYKANIEGIDVHYMRIAPKDNKNVKVIPLLLIHGWPGSIVEYLKMIPLLNKHNEDFVFDIICPSIPGYGYSEAPHKMGFNVISAAKVFNKLMISLKFDNYYVQGTDWGSLIGTTMGIFYPNKVRGLHVNLVIVNPTGPRFLLNFALGHLNKNWVLDEGQTTSIFPFWSFLSTLIQDTGYMHIQATKPDTVGAGLSDSPAGLAAYILEKFSVFTNYEYRHLPDGGLTKKFSLDDLLTNVMVYWTTNSITSSARFYKENIQPSSLSLKLDKLPVNVPVGMSVFTNEVIAVSKSLTEDRYRDIVLFRHHSKGGHFATMEEPETFTKDVIDFVKESEGRLNDMKK